MTRRKRSKARSPWWQKHVPPMHSDAAHHAITAELVRLTLGGQPERPELMVDSE